MASFFDNRGLTVLLFSMLFVSFSIMTSEGSVHNVGGSTGWTIKTNVDYKSWALTKTFQLGDTIVFTYNPMFHNVMRVTHAKYRACNVSSPMSTHSTGNDSIIIDGGGHHFFVCGFPGHCQAGQKVDINVPHEPLLAPSPTGSPVSSVAMVGVPSPSASGGAPTVVYEKFGSIALLLQLLILFGLPQFCKNNN